MLVLLGDVCSTAQWTTTGGAGPVPGCPAHHPHQASGTQSSEKWHLSNAMTNIIIIGAMIVVVIIILLVHDDCSILRLSSLHFYQEAQGPFLLYVRREFAAGSTFVLPPHLRVLSACNLQAKAYHVVTSAALRHCCAEDANSCPCMQVRT